MVNSPELYSEALLFARSLICGGRTDLISDHVWKTFGRFQAKNRPHGMDWMGEVVCSICDSNFYCGNYTCP
jgi:hypothetical protein